MAKILEKLGILGFKNRYNKIKGEWMDVWTDTDIKGKKKENLRGSFRNGLPQMTWVFFSYTWRAFGLVSFVIDIGFHLHNSLFVVCYKNWIMITITLLPLKKL